MKSETLSSFWKVYDNLDESVKNRARKAYRLSAENPFHPSLHFKCINHKEKIWSLRITLNYRVLGIFENDTVTWFWVGSHKEYERFFSQ
ncbi:Type II toxin-antitoxin system HigB family toxin [Candidatus Magnetomoraceae bacterium gMMP-15]